MDPDEGRQAVIDEFGHPNEVGTYDWFGALTRTRLLKPTKKEAARQKRSWRNVFTRLRNTTSEFRTILAWK